MKTSVRFLSMLLAVLMIASAALTASATNADATANSEALQLLVDLGIFGGYDDGSLKPDNQVTRAEMAKIIFVLYTTFTDAGEGVVSFNDVAADNWAAGYISWCSSKGIVGGYGNGNFGPDNKVTYDQALKMVCGALGYTEWDSKFWPTDVRTKALTELGLGKNITDVKGSDNVTRAQIAQIVYNALTAEMNETKLVPQPLQGITINVPVNKTLAVDTWKFSEINAVVTATEQVTFDELQEEGTILLEWSVKENGEDGCAFVKALHTRDFEDDAPNFTPRISGILHYAPSDTFHYQMSILKSANGDGSVCNRYFYSYTPRDGFGHFIHTYKCDGNPLPSFEGEPKTLELPDVDIDTLTDLIWENLNSDNKVSLFVRYIDLATGEFDSRIVNKNK